MQTFDLGNNRERNTGAERFSLGSSDKAQGLIAEISNYSFSDCSLNVYIPNVLFLRSLGDVCRSEGKVSRAGVGGHGEIK